MKHSNAMKSVLLLGCLLLVPAASRAQAQQETPAQAQDEASAPAQDEAPAPAQEQAPAPAEETPGQAQEEAPASSESPASDAGEPAVALIPVAERKVEEPTAPPDDSGYARLESVVVTAQKREQFITDVPMSVTAISGDQLEKLGAQNLRDIAAVTPSFSVVESGPGVQQLQMRGISSAFGQATVGYQLDNVSLSSFSMTQPDAATFDLHSVEILRGPQGTLYGEGSMGGTVKLLTRQPRMGVWEIVARGDSLLTDGSDPSLEGNAAINVPIGESAALRAVGGVSKLGGYIDQVVLGQKNHNRATKRNARVRGRWEPGSDWIVGGMALYQSIEAGSVNAADAQYNKYDGVDVGIKDHGSIYSLDLNWMPGWANVFLTASQFRRDNQVIFDAREAVTSTVSTSQLPLIGGLLSGLDPLLAGIAGNLVRGSPGAYAVDSDSQMTELRVSSVGGGPWTWTTGAYARRYHQVLDLDASLVLSLPGVSVPAAPPLPAVSIINVTTDTRGLASSLFGQLEYDWTDWLNTAVGARYFREKLDIVGSGNTLTLLDSSSNDRLQYSAFTPRAVASAKAPKNWFGVIDEALFYLSYAQGFRSGGANIQASAEIPPTYGPDTLNTFELGSKLMFWDGRLIAELAVYYNQWNDVQVVVVPPGGTGSFTAIQNAGNARGHGIDWNFVITPWRQLTLYQSGGYIDTSFVTDSGAKRKGDPIDFVSPLTLAAGASYGFHWPSDYPGALRVDYSYAGVSRYQREGNYDRYSDPVHMLNARLSLDTTAAQFALYGRNLLDNEGALDANAPERQSRARPPSYGIEMKVEF